MVPLAVPPKRPIPPLVPIPTLFMTVETARPPAETASPPPLRITV
jgi:hypothetical protein